jgi:SAM-dependent methyltransferase
MVVAENGEQAAIMLGITMMSPDASDRVFDEFWRTAWREEPTPLAVRQFRWMLESVSDRRYERALEIGCGEGSFARHLAPHAGSLIAIDVSEEAIGRARAQAVDGVEFRVEDVMRFPLREEGPWDLIVISETMPYLGWRHTFFDLAWLAGEIFAATRPGGRLLVVDTQRGVNDALYRPWIIRAYHDLFPSVGFRPEAEAERRFADEEGFEIEFLLTVFGRDAEPAGDR